MHRLWSREWSGRAWFALTVVAGLAASAPALRADDVMPDGAVEVKVERVRPVHEKLPTLRFLKDNRDFIRARYDALRAQPLDASGDAGAVDPRFLAYQRMLAEVFASRDSLQLAEEARRSHELFASVTELGKLESQLDQMDRALAEQQARLGTLQADFTGHQATALSIVVSGYPAGAAITALAVQLEDGGRLEVPLSPAQQSSLQHGGILEVFHGLLEPREQVVQVSLEGPAWPAADAGYLMLDPARDRLTFLRLDLAAATPAAGAPSIVANSWLHDGSLPAPGGAETHP